MCLTYLWTSALLPRYRTSPFLPKILNALTFSVKLFDGMLRMYFHGRKGNIFIVKGDYELTTAGSRSLLNLIDPAEWNTTIKPGIIIEMKAIIRRMSRPNYRSDIECPCCRRIIPGVRVDVPTVWCALSYSSLLMSDLSVFGQLMIALTRLVKHISLSRGRIWMTLPLF